MRDPSFEIYSPPYLHWGIRQPRITAAPRSIDYGRTIHVKTSVRASKIRSVALVRNASLTHLVDADQRSVVLRLIRRKGHRLTLAAPPNGNVAPPGPYMLFANRRTPRGLVPSKSAQTFVGVAGLER